MQRGPTKPRAVHRCTDVEAIDKDVTASLKRLREQLAPVDDSETDIDLCTVEMFSVIALRIMRKTNPSKVRSEAMTAELSARLDGKPEARRPPLGERR